MVNKIGAGGLTNRQNDNSTADLLTNIKSTNTPASTQAASSSDELNEIFSSHSTTTPTSFDVTDVLKPIAVTNAPTQSSGMALNIFSLLFRC